MADANFDEIMQTLRDIHEQQPEMAFGKIIQTAIDRHKKKMNVDLHDLTSKEIKTALQGWKEDIQKVKIKEKEIKIRDELRIAERAKHGIQ